jgi:DNA mismatch repair protein MutL
MITVRQLFFNTPARRKFLKTIGTEMGHIADMVARIALGNSAVQFRLNHNDKRVKNWSAAPEKFARVVDVLGNDLKNSLQAVEFGNAGISICGWISLPRASRRTSRGIYIYVNGRFVRDRIVQHALFEGYSQRLVKGQFPVAVIFIDVPPDAVDVNVHPTKNEVRFARQKDVHEAVRRAVAQTLYEKDRPQWAPANIAAGGQDSGLRQISEGGVIEFGRRNAEGGKDELEFGRRNLVQTPDHRYRASSIEPRASSTRTSQPATRNADPAPPNPHLATRSAQHAIWKKKPFSDMRVIGQFHNTYIVCESEQGLILIDQHAAHERILFDQFSVRSADARKSAQRLLVPETIELGYREAGVLEKLIPQLSELGLDIEPFGGNTFVVKAVPVLLAGREIKPVLIEIVEKIAETGAAASGLGEALDQSRIVLACHTAIRANQALSQTQIKGLLSQLDGCHNPAHCPHGRPTWIHWDTRALEKSFKRIV